MTSTTEANSEVKVYLPPRDVIEPAFAQNNIALFFGCDNNFFAPAMTVVASIMEHASPENNYDIFIVQEQVPPERLARAVEWMRQFPNASLRFIDVRVMLAMADSERFLVTRHFNVTVYFRIFAPRIFAKYSRIAYLDSDIAVLADIADFYRQDMEGKLVAACHDFATEEQARLNPVLGEHWRTQLGKEPGEDYFLSGGVVMDLAGMRRERTQDQFLAKMRDLKGSALPDQDVMNAVLRGKVKFLSCEWNYLDWMADPLEESLNFKAIGEADLEKVRKARGSFKVMHFTERKPWTPDYMGKNDSYFWKYAVKTPFYQDLLADLGKQLTVPKTLLRYLRLLLQTWNFRLRSLVCPQGRKQKYAARLFNLKMRKRGVIRQFRRARRGVDASDDLPPEWNA